MVEQQHSRELDVFRLDADFALNRHGPVVAHAMARNSDPGLPDDTTRTHASARSDRPKHGLTIKPLDARLVWRGSAKPRKHTVSVVGYKKAI